MTEAEKLQALRREIHAGLAMHALLTNPHTMVSASEPGDVEREIAEQAYAQADAMIAKGGPLE